MPITHDEEPETNKVTIGNLLRYTDRNGIYDLISWLYSTDFFTAPAGTKYHGAFAGGLASHSLNVLDILSRLVTHFGYTAIIPYESIIITALLHDVCKIGCYQLVDDKYKFQEEDYYGGHGCKSVFLIQRFIQLAPDEIKAINGHMGAYENSSYHDAGRIFSECPLAWLLHVADEASTYLDKT